MYSGRIELGDLPIFTEEEGKDRNVSCVKLSDNCHLHNLTEEVYPMNNHLNENIEIPTDMLYILSWFYAQLLIAICSAAVFLELLHENLPLFYIHDYLFIYLLAMGILLLVGAFINKFRERFVEINIRELIQMPQYLSKKLVGEINKLNIDKFFKVGIHAFGILVIFTNGLEVISTFLSHNNCLTAVNISHITLRCIFIGLQIAFFLMNSKEIWNIFGSIRNLAFMHLFATNAALLIRQVLWESVKDWEAAVHVKYNSSVDWDKNELSITVHALESDLESVNNSRLVPNHVVHYTYNCWWRVKKTDEIDVTSIQNCLQNSTIGTVWSKTNEFLYPVLMQYFFLVLCVLYVIWVNFNSIRDHSYSFNLTKKSRNDAVCSRSTKGLFLGLMVFTASIITMIIFFTVENSSKLIFRILYSVIFSSSCIASLLGIVQSRKIKFSESTDIYCASFLRNSGLLVIYFYGACNIIAGAISNEKLSFVLCLEAMFMILHASLQNIFIVQISRRKVYDMDINNKPGRQAVAYLILCNISLWILECFVSWNFVKQDLQLFIFGNKAWPLITRIAYPVITFYRLHSSISLLKAWKKSYT